MKPLNLDNKPCSPTSSNCVIWQGPDIECITLCKGDSVSDVVHSLAVELCTVMKQTNVSSYDLTCLGITSACPPENFEALLQLLISKICELEKVPASSPTTDSGCPDCVVSVAACFVEGTTTTMQLVDYVQAIALKVCALIDSITDLQTQIDNIDIRVTALETATPPSFTIPPITTGCLQSVIPGNPATETIDIVLDYLLNDSTIGYCSTITALFGSGSAADILSVVNPACIQGSSASIVSGNDAGVGTMSGDYASWVNTPLSLADTLNNLWIAICDLRNITTVAFTNSATVSFTQNTGLPNYNFTANVNQPRALIRCTGSNTLGGGANVINSASGLNLIKDGLSYIGLGGAKDLCTGSPFKLAGVAGSIIYDTFSTPVTTALSGQFVIPPGFDGVYNIGYNIVLTAPTTSVLPVVPNPAIAGTFFGTGKGWYGGDNLLSNDSAAGATVTAVGGAGSGYTNGLATINVPGGDDVIVSITVDATPDITGITIINGGSGLDNDLVNVDLVITQAGSNNSGRARITGLTKPNPKITVLSTIKNVTTATGCDIYANDSFDPNNSVSKCTLSGTSLGVVLKEGDRLEVQLGLFINDEDPLSSGQPNPRWEYLSTYLATSDYFEFFIQKIGD